MTDEEQRERDELVAEVDRLTDEVKQWKTDLAQALETLSDIGAEQRMAEFERLKKACG